VTQRAPRGLTSNQSLSNSRGDPFRLTVVLPDVLDAKLGQLRARGILYRRDPDGAPVAPTSPARRP
jgi:hypothetical protein